MVNIVVMLALLVLPYWLLVLAQVPAGLRGRIGIALVFAFTGIGHFIKTRSMAQMLPDWVPARIPLIYVSGVFELLAAVAILITPLTWYAGISLCVFVILVTPSNVYAALNRVDFGGHGAGPKYLLIRLPLQLFLLAWIYWFAVR